VEGERKGERKDRDVACHGTRQRITTTYQLLLQSVFRLYRPIGRSVWKVVLEALREVRVPTRVVCCSLSDGRMTPRCLGKDEIKVP
jgi:hypothetical protein